MVRHNFFNLIFKHSKGSMASGGFKKFVKFNFTQMFQHIKIQVCFHKIMQKVNSDKKNLKQSKFNHSLTNIC